MTDLARPHIFIPAKRPGDARTLLLLHGTGGDESDLLLLGRAIAPDANLFSPRGMVTENGMNRFFRRFAEGQLDTDDLKAQALSMADFIKQAATAYGFDAHEVVAVGYSNGANLAAGMLFGCPASLAGAVLLRPMLPYEPGILTPLASKPVLILGGTQDTMIPKSSTERLAEVFRVSGAAVKTVWVPSGHSLSESDAKEAHAFLRL